MASGIRARVRAEMTAEIKSIARAQLGTEGANLSLRAIARDLGVVSSAVYRYFASRDDLLTALIIDAYNDLGSAVEVAEAPVPRADLLGRFLAVAGALHDWATANPPEYALLYGSPVPGYAAPQDTIGPAARSVLVLAGILSDGARSGRLSSPTSPRLAKTTRDDLRAIGREMPAFAGIPEPLLALGIGAWAQLFGLLSFELFGQLVGVVSDYRAFYDYQVRSIAERLGLT